MRKLILTILLAVGVASVAQAREQISITGSSTVYPFSTVVAERFGETGFKTPVVESTGTGGGMKIFCKGIGTHTPDITNASRKIKDKEIKLCKSNGVAAIDQVIVGLDGIAFVQNGDQKQVNFTRQQIWQAMAAKGSLPKKWSDIDPSLPNIEIAIMVPPPTSGTRDAYVELVQHKACKKLGIKKKGPDGYKKRCSAVREDGGYIEAGENDNLIIQKLGAEKRRFGIFGFSFLDENADKVQGVTIDGVYPEFEDIASGKYPVSRPLFFYVKKQHLNNVSGLREYVKYFISKQMVGEEGATVEKGLIPLPEDEYKSMTERVLAEMK